MVRFRVGSEIPSGKCATVGNTASRRFEKKKKFEIVFTRSTVSDLRLSQLQDLECEWGMFWIHHLGWDPHGGGENVHTGEGDCNQTIITMLVVKTTALISLIITWRLKSLKSYGISQKKEKKRAKLDHRVTMRMLQLHSGTQTLAHRAMTQPSSRHRYFDSWWPHSTKASRWPHSSHRTSL